MESNSAILKHRGTTYTLNELPVKLKLSNSDEEVIKARLKGVSFEQLSEVELKLATDQIAVKSSVLCGCELPASELIADSLHDEIIFLMDKPSYRELSMEEVFLALRINATGAAEYLAQIDIEPVIAKGNLTISFLSKVIENYLKIRSLIDRKIQNQIDGY